MPEHKESRPAGNEAATNKLLNRDTHYTPPGSHTARRADEWDLLRDCPPESLGWATFGYIAGVQDGRQQLIAELADDTRDLDTSALSAPVFADLEELRVFKPRPCAAARCGKCALCVQYDAWQRRGGRDFPGVGK